MFYNPQLLKPLLFFGVKQTIPEIEWTLFLWGIILSVEMIRLSVVKVSGTFF